MKADLELIRVVMQRNNIDPRHIATVLEEVREEIDTQAEERQPQPKKQFVILVSDPKGELAGKDLIGWVIQIAEADHAATTVGRLYRSAYEYNITPKGRRLPLKTIGETCEVVPARFTKEQQVWIKTREPVFVVPVGNAIPFGQEGHNA